MAAGGGGGGDIHGGSRPDIESFLTCSICMEPFRRPKILPCVHTFCCQCLKSYLTTSSSNKLAVNRKKGGFSCPTCRQHVPVAKPSKPPEMWPDQLKDNFVLSSMLEALNKETDKHPASSSSSSPSLSGTQPSAESGTTGCTCRLIPDVVCWDCAVFVCAACSATSHAQCSQVQNISEAGPEKRQEMLDWVPRLHAQLADMEGQHAIEQAFLRSLRARHQSTQDQITLAANDAIRIVRLQEQELKQKMDKDFEVVIQHHHQRLKANFAAIEDLKTLKSTMEKCVAEADVALLRQAQGLKQRYVAVTVQNPVERSTGNDEGEDQVLNAGTFLPSSFADLQSTVLVGVYLSHGTDQSEEPRSSLSRPSAAPMSSSPPSEITSGCRVEQGPIIHHRPRCHSSPSEIASPISPIQREPNEQRTSCDESPAECSLSSPFLQSGQRAVTCRLSSSFSARAKGDKAEPFIRDLVVIANGWLVATDTANRCVKCYFKSHVQDVKYQCKRLVLSHAPYGVCRMEGHLVAVTVPKERQLHLITVHPHLVPLSTLSLPLLPQETTWGVGSLGEQRVVVTTCPQGEVGSLLVLQVSGDKVQCVARFTSVVTTPLYISVTSDHHIVITDPTSCHVACVTSDSGNAVFHFHTNGKVMGVTCHSQLILVVDQSPALSLLTNEGHCLHTLTLPKGKAGCSHPRAVAVATDSTVHVSDDNGKIHLFCVAWQ